MAGIHRSGHEALQQSTANGDNGRGAQIRSWAQNPSTITSGKPGSYGAGLLVHDAPDGTQGLCSAVGRGVGNVHTMASGHGLRTNVIGTTGPGDRVLLLVHGYGADEYDLAGLAPMLDPTGRCCTVCPRGPIELDFGGAGWYQRSEDGVIDSASLASSVAALDQLLDEVCQQRSCPRDQAVLIGFSQGGAMALAVALGQSAKARPAGVACLSGMLQTPAGVRYVWDDPEWPGSGVGSAGSVALPAVYVQHGTHDPMVNIERGRHTRAVLASHGIEPEYHEYPMGHEIRPESILDLRVWLDRVLSAT